MRNPMMFLAAVVLTVSAAPAMAQSSNTSSNSSSNNGVTRERIVDTYCDNGVCRRTVERNVYRDDRRGRRYRDDDRRSYRDYERRRYRDRDRDDNDDD